MSTPTDNEAKINDEAQPTTAPFTDVVPEEHSPDAGFGYEDTKAGIPQNPDADPKPLQNDNDEMVGAPPIVTSNPAGISTMTAVTAPPAIRVAEGVPPDSGRDARIAQRKGRIELNRLARIRPELTEDNTTRRKAKTDADNKELGKAKMQINQSKRQIENVKRDGTDSVTDVRVGVIARESTRRQEECRKTDVWLKKKNDVARKGEEAHVDIQAMWESAMAIKGPHALNEMLIKQREACSLLIASKNKLIAEYTAELKNKDDDYVKELKRQAEEIDSLLQRMDTEYKKYQQTLRGELEQIERAFMEERTELIDSNVKELESLFLQRRLNEQKYMEERAERIEEHIKLLESLRVHDAEEYNIVKIKLETDVQVLEQQLQQMRATYQLNTEKLDYNFQVLKKRDDENTVTMNQQKRKVTRVTDILNSLKAKFNKQEKMFQQEYFVLTEDYKRITEQFKELQKKYHHFQITDNKKFRDVWNMNEEISRELMRKVLLADRIIYEQQLGLSWKPPSEDLFKNSGPGLFSNDDAVDSLPNPLIARSPVSSPVLPAIHRGDETEDGPSGYGGQILDKLKDFKGFNKTLRKMLEMLCNEVGFLVEEKLNKLLTPLHKDEQSLMKLDSIFKALGVETIEDIDKLSSYFIVQSQDATLATAATSDKNSDSSEDGPSALPASQQLIHPNDVVKAIRKFIEDHRSELQQSNTAVNLEQAESSESNRAESPLEQEGMQTSAETPIQKPRSELQREYWERMAGIIDEKGCRVWDGVYASMNRYNQTLTERWTLTQEINEISQQNEELKSLLRQYMAANVNDELEIPPTKIMLAQAGIGMNGTRAATSTSQIKMSEGISVRTR